MKKITYTEIAEQMSETNDDRCCTVIALAQLLNINYKEAYDIAKSHGREHGVGMHWGDMYAMYKIELAKIGYVLNRLSLREILETIDRPNYRVGTLTTNNLKMSGIKGMCVVLTNAHVSVYDKGATSDYCMNKAKHVKRLWQVRKMNAAQLNARQFVEA